MERTLQAAFGASVYDAALSLALSIKALPEWEELQDARERFRADPEMAAIMARYRTAFGQWTAARRRGAALADADATELATCQSELENHPLYLRQHEATTALVSALQTINRVLTTELGMDFAANAAPRGSGCCG